MIAQIAGILLRKDLDYVEVMTSGGIAYEIAVPLGTFESLPRLGDAVTLYTHVVVREDDWQLYGFAAPTDRRVFRRLLEAKGVGPALALGMLSALSAERVVRAIRERDVATLQSVPRVGRKKAEQMILDLADKLDGMMDAGSAATRTGGAAVDDAIRALVSLGYPPPDSEKAVRHAVQSMDGPAGAAELVRAALPFVGRK